MGKKVFIDGNLLVKKGLFYGHNFIMYSSIDHRNESDEIIITNNDILEIGEDYGSMFNTYYVKGGITMYGVNGSGIYMFINEHKNTLSKYLKTQSHILQLLERTIIPKELKPFFYQQQYASLIANLEYFLYNTFLWETCQCYENYKRVCELFACDCFKLHKSIKKIFRNEHNISQEITFVKQTGKIIYHRIQQVSDIYKSAFNINVDLSILENEIQKRHDIVHRAGYTKDDKFVKIAKEQVINLNDKISKIVNDTTEGIKVYKNKHK